MTDSLLDPDTASDSRRVCQALNERRAILDELSKRGRVVIGESFVAIHRANVTIRSWPSRDWNEPTE